MKSAVAFSLELEKKKKSIGEITFMILISSKIEFWQLKAAK